AACAFAPSRFLHSSIQVSDLGLAFLVPRLIEITAFVARRRSKEKKELERPMSEDRRSRRRRHRNVASFSKVLGKHSQLLRRGMSPESAAFAKYASLV